MLNSFKNRLIVYLIKHTHIYADVCYVLISKICPDELNHYIELYNSKRGK